MKLSAINTSVTSMSQGIQSTLTNQTKQDNQDMTAVKKNRRKPYREMSLQELYDTYTKKAKNAQFKADRIKTQINNEALEGIMKRNK